MSEAEPIIVTSQTAGRRERRFCVVFAAVTCVMLFGVGLINFVVNPYAQYLPGWFQPLVQTSRAEKVQLLAAATTTPRGLVLGSSRVLKFEPDYLQQATGVEFFNAGMNYARPEDYLAFLRYYNDTVGKAPKVVIVGLDVNAFTNAVPPDARLMCQPELASRVPEAISAGDRMRRWRELLSWQQTRMSLSSLKMHLTSAGVPEPVESFRDDGLIVYHEREQQLADGSYDFEAALEYNRGEYEQLIGDFTELSKQRCGLFEQLAKQCKADNTRLVVFLTPLHPELATHLRQRTDYGQRKEQVVAFLADLSKKQSFELHDLATVESFGGNPELFVDGIHPLEPNTRRMIDRLLASTTRSLVDVVQ